MNLGKMQLMDPNKMNYEDSIDIIREELHKTRKSFIKIGWYLKHIEEKQMHLENGYSTIYDLAFDKFNITETTATRFIRLCENFSVGNNSPELDDKYEDFNVSQLFEMLPMQKEERELIGPDMTVKEIREVKKSLKEKNATSHEKESSNQEDVIPGQTSIQDFPQYLPEQSKEESKFHATSHEEKFSCPSNVSSCTRQQWGTDAAEQEEGRKECNKCWEHHKKFQTVLIDGETSLQDIELDDADQEGELKENQIIDGSFRKLESNKMGESMQVQTTNIALLEEKTVQNSLPILKNTEERKLWLADYKSWGLWYRDENIDVNYYKFDFEDGSRLIACEYPLRECEWTTEPRDEVFYHLLLKNKERYEKGKGTYDEKFRHTTSSETYIIEFLKSLKRRKE